MIRGVLPALVLAACALPGAAADFGLDRDRLLAERSAELFGIEAPLTGIVIAAGLPYRQPDQAATDQVAAAPGLTVDYLTREAADTLDQMAFWPAENPTHLIGCIESGRKQLPDGRFNPSVQSIALADGTVTTLLRGMASCDGIRATPWGSLIVSEETPDGGVYEIIDPLDLRDATVLDRASGEVTDPDHVAKRSAMPAIAWEGLAITAGGVIYGGDELRPGGASPDADGGSIYKFIPAKLHPGGSIDRLDDSPLVAGRSYALQVSCQGDTVQYGQGCEVGNGTWIEVDPARARADADAAGATGYYRPEDIAADKAWPGPGFRFCGANDGNEASRSYGEIVCTLDLAPAYAPQPGDDGRLAFPTVVNRFLDGDGTFNSFDNLDFQPGTGILYVVEDHPLGEIYACLPDGLDRDIRTDGCIRVLAIKDVSAEPTGLIFSEDGQTAYLSIQHSDDSNMPAVDGYRTDDLIRVTGFRRPGT